MGNILKKNILIIGSGAAGMMTAISAGIHGARNITLLDVSPNPGMKILMSGGGRCNITNANLDFKNYFGESPNAIKKVILQFPPEKVIEFFENEGLSTKIEDPWKKYFPVIDDAQSVLNVLFNKLKELEVELIYPQKVTDFFPENNVWIVKSDSHVYETVQLVLAFGGFSYPHTGSDGSLWRVLKKLKIDIKNDHAALTPIKTSDKDTHDISGVTQWCKISVKQAEKIIFTENNSILFTHDGLSGPGILDISQWFTSREFSNLYKLELSFLPDKNKEEFEQIILNSAPENQKQLVSKLLSKFIPNRLSELISIRTKTVGKSVNQLSKSERKEILTQLFHFSPTVSGHFGYKKAEVTAGGIPFSEMDLKTMQIKKYPNLFAVGEVVNVNGIIGGYNFQWAWSSGWVCGKNLI